ncbi:DUF2188 domain-containing protein [Oleiagrimonas sp. C23AA]|uniref:DUF2188 domain-containing protein n=1 Tax=Oleiagrimonas sp. C23AA TaxID=2719047 RepID=UPI00141E26CB|nr:DUF2188 domain-containing protein [Oleiagrimonas sp. C23AA]NII11130.1 DUF2188 domain-containing protein [Oleiagrimonas sp. C23AA]
MTPDPSQLFVPYVAGGHWVVRRSRVVISTHGTRDEAILAAKERARDLASRMDDPMRVHVQDEHGAWDEISWR